MVHWFVISFLCNAQMGCSRLPDIHTIPKPGSPYSEVQGCLLVAKTLIDVDNEEGGKTQWVETICEPRDDNGKVVSWMPDKNDDTAQYKVQCAPSAPGTMGECNRAAMVGHLPKR